MTSLDRNFSDFANILMQRRQMKMQEQENAKQNQLRDLQLKQLKREDEYQTGLAGAMSSPGVIRSTTIAPDAKPSLANLMPGNQLQPTQFQPQGAEVGPLSSRVQTTETPRSAAAAGAEYALSKGKIEDAVKLFSVDDHVAQLKAKGNLQEYYQAQRELDEGNKFFEVVNRFKENPSQLAAMWPQIQRVFPKQSEGLDPSRIQFGADYTVAPLVVNGQEIPGKAVLKQGKSVSVIDTAPKPDQEALLDKRFANQQKLTQMQIDAADRRAAADRAAADRRAGEKSSKPDGVVVREAVKDLPKLRREANTAAASKERIAQMQQLLSNGAGGLSGNILSRLSTVFDTPATSEADLFKKLASAGAGQLRATVVGPGPVSNYEQQLLQSVSGGGAGARSAIKKLLDFYATEADRTINAYDDALEGATAVAPDASKAFKPVRGKSGSSSGKGAKKDPLGIL